MCAIDQVGADERINGEGQDLRSFPYSSLSQHERRKRQSPHLAILPVSIRYRLPEAPVIPSFAISPMQGGSPDLQPCLLSQLMQYPISLFVNASFLHYPQASGVQSS